jgi:small-conductance mechanosensitive channel
MTGWFWVIYIIITQILDLTYISTISLLIIIGLALGLAFQDILKDIIAGLIVPFEGHIEKGNKIQIGDIYGEIYKTGFRETIIKTPDGNIVVVPNSRIIKETITSVSAERENSPVVVDFYLPFSSDLDKCRDLAHKSAIVSPYLFLDKEVTIQFSNELSNGQPIIKMRVEASLRKIEFQSLFISELTETVIKEIGYAKNLDTSLPKGAAPA